MKKPKTKVRKSNTEEPKWYHIGYDTEGNGFSSLPEPHCWALGKEELNGVVSYAIEECNIHPDLVCVFELISTQISSTTKIVPKKEYEEHEVIFGKM